MPNIPPPRNPKTSDDVRGPNSPGTVDPGFNDPFRNPGGDVGRVGRVTGRRPAETRDPYGWPIRR